MMSRPPEPTYASERQPGRGTPKPRRFFPCLLGALLVLSGPAPAAPPRPLPTPLYGVTVDAIDNLEDIVAALESLPKRPTARIVFDEDMPPREYVEAVDSIGQVSYIMGEILDSQYLKRYTVNRYARRTSKYLKAFGSKVDIWEIGNEVNGEWVGKPRAVVRKIATAYRQAKVKKYRTALTLIYNEGCWDNPDNEMFNWADKYIPRSMKSGLDYVLVSYYEEDCNNLRPDWTAVFARLAGMFPNSKIGFGETGTKAASEKADYLTRYYTLSIPQPSYIGGYFWWYFKDDQVPSTQPLWKVLSDAIR
jgi:hypothetical protein